MKGLWRYAWCGTYSTSDNMVRLKWVTVVFTYAWINKRHKLFDLIKLHVHPHRTPDSALKQINERFKYSDVTWTTRARIVLKVRGLRCVVFTVLYCVCRHRIQEPASPHHCSPFVEICWEREKTHIWKRFSKPANLFFFFTSYACQIKIFINKLHKWYCG